FRRHGGDAVGAADGADQQARSAFAGNDGGAGVAAFADAGGGVEAQAGALLVRPVTAEAVLRQQRLDLHGVIDRLRGGDDAGQQNSNESGSDFHGSLVEAGSAGAGGRRG